MKEYIYFKFGLANPEKEQIYGISPILSANITYTGDSFTK